VRAPAAIVSLLGLAFRQSLIANGHHRANRAGRSSRNDPDRVRSGDRPTNDGANLRDGATDARGATRDGHRCNIRRRGQVARLDHRDTCPPLQR